MLLGRLCIEMHREPQDTKSARVLFLIVLGILCTLIDNAIFVTIAKPFHCTKITAAASVQYLYCKLEILSMNLMSLISQHSSCSYQLCPYALMCLLDYVQLVQAFSCKTQFNYKQSNNSRRVLFKTMVYHFTLFQILIGVRRGKVIPIIIFLIL